MPPPASPPPARLSRLAAAAAEEHSDCAQLDELVTALTERELADARAAHHTREKFNEASRRLDRELVWTRGIAGGMTALVVARIVARSAGVW